MSMDNVHKNARKNPVPLICYHGSPGLPKDFSLLEPLLSEWTFCAFPREHFPDTSPAQSQSSMLASSSGAVLLAYSWGSVPCLLDAAKNIGKVKAIILIAPFLAASNPMSPAKKTLLSLPGVGSFVIGLFAKKAIAEFIESSCHPHPAPESYQACAPALQNPHLLRRALLEKEESKGSVQQACQAIHAARIPVLLLTGTQDATKNAAHHLEQTKKFLPEARVFTVDGGGHALSWTHAQEISKPLREFLTSSLQAG